MKPTVIKSILFKLYGQVIGTYNGDEMSLFDIEKLAEVMAEECEVARDEIDVELEHRNYPDELSNTFIDTTGDLVNFDDILKPISVNKVHTYYTGTSVFMIDVLLNNPDKFLLFSN